MARRDPGMPRAVLDNDFVTAPPKFDEKLMFVFELVPVTPLVVAPMVTPPGQVIPEPTEWQLATKSPELPLPGAIKPGQGHPAELHRPGLAGQSGRPQHHPPCARHADARLHRNHALPRSETRLLGDVKDKDRVAKLFAGDDLLMMKLVIRPKFGDQRIDGDDAGDGAADHRNPPGACGSSGSAAPVAVIPRCHPCR